MTQAHCNGDSLPESQPNVVTVPDCAIVPEAVAGTDRIVYNANAPSYHYGNDQLARRTLAAAR